MEVMFTSTCGEYRVVLLQSGLYRVQSLHIGATGHRAWYNVGSTHLRLEAAVALCTEISTSP